MVTLVLHDFFTQVACYRIYVVIDKEVTCTLIFSFNALKFLVYIVVLLHFFQLQKIIYIHLRIRSIPYKWCCLLLIIQDKTILVEQIATWESNSEKLKQNYHIISQPVVQLLCSISHALDEQWVIPIKLKSENHSKHFVD